MELSDKYLILPSFLDPPHFYETKSINNYYKKKFKAKINKKAFSYNSGQNKNFLTISELKKIISKISIN